MACWHQIQVGDFDKLINPQDDGTKYYYYCGETSDVYYQELESAGVPLDIIPAGQVTLTVKSDNWSQNYGAIGGTQSASIATLPFPWETSKTAQWNVKNGDYVVAHKK